MSSKFGPSSEEMELARAKFPILSQCKTPNEVEEANFLIEKIQNARKKIEHFNSILSGVSAVHPEKDPVKWPPPHGENSNKPPIKGSVSKIGIIL